MSYGNGEPIVGFREWSREKYRASMRRDPTGLLLAAILFSVSIPLIFNPHGWGWQQDLKITVPPGWTVEDIAHDPSTDTLDAKEVEDLLIIDFEDTTMIAAKDVEAETNIDWDSPVIRTPLQGLTIEEAFVFILNRTYNTHDERLDQLESYVRYYHLKLEPKE